ncbi:hypothetical protein [Bradyrhizobium sp.]|uniref:hypothetical protein n=1 Tax=Bradyrhizobium sp. TaxID=376 RepID=UPI001D52BCE3|nr:hypothetical protein [Bradyrhizobium sp.]MBV8698145.1 hypothetical protein [Bradyrhizobium sp.]MBV8916721.1 hypothetical protein [Bradyrhizobium sp.]MBV9980169.1 hypothetical protein [Bradyrhizobium sp.]
MRRLIAIIVAALAFGALSGVAAYQRLAGAGGEHAQWQEIAWPFSRDGWPAGRAFRCMSTACGEGSELYVRAKIGFCNCDTGVADDDEVDRVADLDLISPRFAPRAAGQVVRVAEMSGRARAYELSLPDGARHAAIGFALSHRCDLMVAVAQGGADAPTLQRAARGFLEQHEMHQWMLAALGGQQVRGH